MLTVAEYKKSKTITQRGTRHRTENQVSWIIKEIKKEQNKRYRFLKLYKVNNYTHL